MIFSHGEPLARHGYWRVGGRMERFARPESEADLLPLLEESPLLLGNGSNLLAPDHGVPGLTVRLAGAFRGISMVDGLVRAGAAVANAAVLTRVAREGRVGAGCLSGVPGTIGGAVAMNAGTSLGEVADILHSVEGYDSSGFRRILRADLPMQYRDGGLPPWFVVTAASFSLPEGDVVADRARMAAHATRRKATQPIDLPSCGSVFRNPPGDFAGRLIESVGLKGHRIGGAEISAKHANFIVNLGGASSSEVMACIRLAWTRVREQAGVTLVPEVRVVGEWEDWPLTPR